jgi:hypothetical protein
MSGEESRSKGKLLEHQVAAFMRERGWKPILGRPFSGKIALRKHDCDIFARKRNWGWSFLMVLCFALFGVWLFCWFELLPLELPQEVAPGGILAGVVLGPFALTRSTKYVWVECKCLQQSIKRDLIMKLKDQFRDAVKEVGPWECWLVSTSRFDEDAVAHARAHGVRCFQVVEPGGRNMALHRVDSKTGDV